MRKHPRGIGKASIVIVVIALLVIAAAAGYFATTSGTPQSTTSSSSTSTTPTSNTQNVPNPTHFTWLYPTDVVDLDTATSQGVVEETVEENVYQTLLWHPHNETLGPVQPLLATSWTVSPDGMTYNFTLRQGVTFQDGTQFNASAVKFNFDRVVEIGTAGPYVPSRTSMLVGAAAYYKSNETLQDFQTYLAQNAVQVINNYKISIHLAYPFVGFEDYVASQWPYAVISPTWIMQHGGIQPKTHNLYVESHMMGTGPYSFVSWTPKQSVILQAYSGYWQGAARLKTVEIDVIPDLTTRESELFAGTADMAYIPPSNMFDVVSKGPWQATGAIQVTQPGIKVALGRPTTSNQMFSMNQNIHNPDGTIATFQPFRDIRVREAFALAFNYTTIVYTIMNGLAIQANTGEPIGTPWNDPNVPLVKQDLTAAANLLAQAGYSASNPVTINVEYNTDNPIRQQLALVLQATFRQMNAGIIVNPVGVDVATYSKDIVQKTFPANFIQLSGAGLLSGTGFAAFYVSNTGTFPLRDGYTTGLDPLLNQLYQTTNSAQQTALYDQIQENFSKTYDVAYLYQPSSFDVMRTWVQGFFSNGFYFDVATRPYFYDLYKAPGTATVIDFRSKSSGTAAPAAASMPASLSTSTIQRIGAVASQGASPMTSLPYNTSVQMVTTLVTYTMSVFDRAEALLAGLLR